MLMGTFLILGSSCQKEEESSEIKDKDGNTYTSVTIGTQVWMVENLKTTKFNDGTSIPNVSDGTEWHSLVTPGYCWYNNDASTYKNTYGALYNWYTVNTGKLCPVGWHVPSENEWYALFSSCGGADVAGGILKETGTTHWSSPNDGGTNEKGFTALPGGRRSSQNPFSGVNGPFEMIGEEGDWWSSTEDDYYVATHVNLDHYTAEAWVFSYTKREGYSVRCIKD